MSKHGRPGYDTASGVDTFSKTHARRCQKEPTSLRMGTRTKGHCDLCACVVQKRGDCATGCHLLITRLRNCAAQVMMLDACLMHARPGNEARGSCCGGVCAVVCLAGGVFVSGRFVLHGPLVRRAVIPMPTLANAPKMARLVPAAVACCLALLCVRGASAATECSFCVDHPESCDTPGQYCPSSLAYPKKCEVWRKVCMAAAV